MTLRAVIAGATGLIGSNLAEHLVSTGWEVYGVARKPQTGIRGIRPVAADLLEPKALRTALAGIDPTHVNDDGEETWAKSKARPHSSRCNAKSRPSCRRRRRPGLSSDGSET